MSTTAGGSSIFGPLNLSTEVKTASASSGLEESSVQCLFCDETYFFPLQKDSYLTHLYLVHRLIIGDEPKIAILEDYLRFWRTKFEGMSF